jgi:two-component system NtrC family sensor kinase
MRLWTGTIRKLLLAVGALVLFHAAGSFFSALGLREMHGALHSTKVEAESVRLALELASAVRDQYAHQAHTIIIGDESHLPLYAHAKESVVELTAALRARVSGGEERAWIDEIAAATERLDDSFRRGIVPAVLRGDDAFVQEEHHRAQELVSFIQDRTERLVRRFEDTIRRNETGATAVENRVIAWTIAYLLVGPVLAIGIALYVGRSVARPIARLSAGAERIGKGDLATRIHLGTHDEFEALARRFNAMASSLHEHEEKLVETEKLAGIGRLAAGVAHEINNPLGVILGYTRLLRRKAADGAAEDLAVIEDEVLRCKEIVQGLLELSRPDAASSERVPLRPLADDVVSRLQDASAVRGVTFQLDGAANAAGNGTKLRQVVLNLVRNAAEAAGPGGSVDVTLRESGEFAEVEVGDSGAGVDAAARRKLFEPFFTTKPTGTGLGLAISQSIARAHRGTIEVGTSPRGGALFTLRVPRAAPGTEPERSRDP